MHRITITAKDGYELSAIYMKPADYSIGTIVISSATGIRKEFYINFSKFLETQGYDVLLFDYRGIGESAPRRLQNLKCPMHEWGTKDMNAVIQFLVKEERKTGIIWIGHSVGAQLVGFLENKEHIAKVISINSALGYWRYFPAPQRWVIWGLWYFLGPIMVKTVGYGAMTKIGWGENLPPRMLMEWRKWCLSKTYFRNTLREKIDADSFYDFNIPITAVFMSDDFIANEKTVPLMLDFFPNATKEIFRLPVHKFTKDKVGHTGLFRKKFKYSLWPLMLTLIRKPVRGTKQQVIINELPLKQAIVPQH